MEAWWEAVDWWVVVSLVGVALALVAVGLAVGVFVWAVLG